MSHRGVKLELADHSTVYLDRYRNLVLPGIRQTLSSTTLQDVAVVCGDGSLIWTSAMLLASISPWLRSLMEAAGEEFCLSLPCLSSHQFSSYLASFLTTSPRSDSLSLSDVHLLLFPSNWQSNINSEQNIPWPLQDPQTEVCGTPVKVEVMVEPGHNNQEEFDDNEQVSLDLEENIEVEKCRRGSRQKGQILDDFDLSDESYSSQDEWSSNNRKKRNKKKVGKKIEEINKSKEIENVKLEREIMCQDCGEYIERGKGKDGGKLFQKHKLKHQVENFTCDCPDLPEITQRPGNKIRVENNFALRERHMKVIHLGWLGCSKCHYSFEKEKKLMEHTDKYHATENPDEKRSSVKEKKKRGPNRCIKWPKDMLCPDCGENIGKGREKDGGKYFLRHQLKHQVENFVCECPDVPRVVSRPDQERVSRDFVIKERHMKVEHLGWFGCSDCTQSFETEVGLNDHKGKHARTFICDHCGFAAESPTMLKQHTLRKHESTPVPCPDCGKIVSSEVALKSHKKKVHSAAPCVICGAVIKNMKVHMEDVHMDDSEKRLHCSDCGKGFMTKQRLDTHRMNIHIKTQPHRCRYGCENRYNDKSNRNAHEKRRHGRLFTLLAQPIQITEYSEQNLRVSNLNHFNNSD